MSTQIATTAALLASGDVYSHRDGFNVLFPGAGDSAGNNHYGKGRGPVVDQVRALVRQAISEDVQPGWLRTHPEYDVVVSPDQVTRGMYHYTVYSRVITPRVPRTLPKHVETYGYLWFNGHNTYHTVIVFADGVEIFRSAKPAYGYGNGYEETSFRAFLEWAGLPEPEYHPNGSRIVAWRWFEENGITYDRKAFDVKRKRDMLAFMPFMDKADNT